MNSIELYINNQLCDIENPADFSVYLKRQLLSPGELSKKDAQKSYDITLPATATNNAIFGYTNIEEIKGKFASLYDATLIVNGIKIFDGKFRLSEITNISYKGNLGVPAKEIKDIFGDKMMNEMGEWPIPYSTEIKDLDHSIKVKDTIEQLNNQENPPCFFPFVLYGLLNKNINSNTTKLNNHDKSIWEDSEVIHTYKNIHPSVNCMQLIAHLFSQNGYKIGGTAFDDEALKHIYMSYKNPKDKIIAWDVISDYQNMKVKGHWQGGITSDQHPYADVRVTEDATHVVGNPTIHPYNARAYVIHPSEIYDRPITDIHYQQYINNDKNNYSFFRVPKSGTYRLELSVDLSFSTKYSFYLNKYQFEIQLRKSQKNRNPISLPPQTIKFNNICMYNDAYPQRSSRGDFRETNRVLPAQDPNFICGLSFGNPQNGISNIPPARPAVFNMNAMVTSGAKPLDRTQKRIYAISNYRGYTIEGNEEPLFPDGQDLVFLKNSDGSFKEAKLTDSSSLTNEQVNGTIPILVSLEKDEEICINLIHDSDPGGFPLINLNFEVSMEIFETNKWLEEKLDENGNLKKENITREIEWDTKNHPTFPASATNLIEYLPSNVKTETWINDFIKALNLTLNQVSENRFELNTKKKDRFLPNKTIDLDNKTDVNINRSNVSLGLPNIYEVKYKIKEDEQGYLETKDKGSDVKIIDRSSNKPFFQNIAFSHNWKKGITKDNIRYMFPVITDKKIWEAPSVGVGENNDEIYLNNYLEMQKELYTDLTQRFWFKDDSEKLLDVKLENWQTVQTAFVTDTYDKGGQRLVLNYKDEPNSILNTYFTLLTDADNCYTTVECYLNPEEYSQIDSSMVKFNGDLYYVAEVDGYDPMCKRKATLKLVRKIQK